MHGKMKVGNSSSIYDFLLCGALFCSGNNIR